MNLPGELIDVYDKNIDKIGIIAYRNEIPYTLLPLYHNSVTAQITVTIDEQGNYLRGEQVEPADKFTIIPVTEKSGSRTAGKEPHPLCDNLRYLAGDYTEYVKDDGECFERYIDQLKRWNDSDICHAKVRAIYSYLVRKSLIADLVKNEVLKITADGMLDEKESIQNIPQPKAFVRFIVRSSTLDVNRPYVPDECWKDRTLQENYIQYVRSLPARMDLCYLTGNWDAPTYLHSKKIRNEGDGAKLMSANDSVYFTYRGRFANKEEAFVVGVEASQKMHNALKWLIRKQGVFFDSLVMVTWESNLLKIPRWDVDAGTIVSDFEDPYEDDLDEEDKAPLVSDGNPITADAFNKAMKGYGKTIPNTSRMVLAGVDAATSGRLSLVEEKTLDASRYLERIQAWHHDCEWVHEKRKEGKVVRFWGMVGIKDIADILYGMENNGVLTIVDANSKKLYAEVAKRISPCIWDGRRIPQDYVNRAIMKASNPLAYKDRKNWERVLTLACSFIKKSRKERNSKEEWKVEEVKEKEPDRSYLYGRLLAVADRIEYRTYDREKNGSRVTNAKRYMNTFAQRPYDTWKVIEENIQPYLNKLELGERLKYSNLLDEIQHQFSVKDFKNNHRLEGLYLLGFHNQSYELKHSKSNAKEENQKAEEK